MTVHAVLALSFIVVVALSPAYGLDLGVRRVRNDGIGELSRSPSINFEPRGCSQGRYLNPETGAIRGTAAYHQGRLTDSVVPQEQPSLAVSAPVAAMGLLQPRVYPVQFVSRDYYIHDHFRHRDLEFFDPEEFVCCNPYSPFPSELDIPAGWAIYNPVTVQAPQPTIIRDLAKYKYTGYYYACPNYVNPFDYSWYFNYDSWTNPCKWVWYQSKKDAIDYVIQDGGFAKPLPLYNTKQNY